MQTDRILQKECIVFYSAIIWILGMYVHCNINLSQGKQ